MFSQTNFTTEPLFFLFVALSFLLAVGYFWGRRHNRAIVVATFDDMARLLQPAEQTYTNIGGSIGYHATYKGGKGHSYGKAEATLLLLPRQSWLYLPISWLIRRRDSLSLTLHLRAHLPAEGHLIDPTHATSRAGRITNADRLNEEKVMWGKHPFLLYWATKETRGVLLELTRRAAEPGTVRHVAILPHPKQCFVFMVPRKNKVGTSLEPVLTWLSTV